MNLPKEKTTALNWALTIAALVFGAGGWAQSVTSVRADIDSIRAENKERDLRDRKRDDALADMRADVKVLLERTNPGR